MSLGKRWVTTGWGDEHNVTHHYHTLFSQPPWNATSTHHDPQRLAMRIHHHDRGMVMTAHEHPRAPSTTINKWRWWPTGHEDPPPWLTSAHEQPQGTTPTINKWPQGETRAEGDLQGMWQNQSAFRSPPAHPSIHAQMNGDTHVVVTVHMIQVSNATPLPLSFFNTRRRGHIAISGMANNNWRTMMTTHTWTITTHTRTMTTMIHGRTTTDGVHMNNDDNGTWTNNDRWHRLTTTWCING